MGAAAVGGNMVAQEMCLGEQHYPNDYILTPPHFQVHCTAGQEVASAVSLY